MKLIDKSALVAEIKRRKQTWQHQDQQYVDGGKDVCDYLLGFLDILEVKGVDEQKERMSECPYRKVGCTMYDGHILECRGACSWVVDYPKLKELKAQKGE